MKKIFLTAAFLLTSVNFVNANSSIEVADSSILVLDCAQDAWDFGTRYGGGDSALEYALTDAYYQEFC